MNEPSDLASRPTRIIEAGVLFGIAIDAIRSIKADPRKGGQRSALVSIVFSMIALESFVNEMTEPNDSHLGGPLRRVSPVSIRKKNRRSARTHSAQSRSTPLVH
jgi:hypothetical protein